MTQNFLSNSVFLNVVAFDSNYISFILKMAHISKHLTCHDFVRFEMINLVDFVVIIPQESVNCSMDLVNGLYTTC